MGIKLIGIHGKARSGKDTLANVFVEEHGFVRMAFADPLKAAASVLFNWPIAFVLSDEFKTFESPFWGMTGREVLQKLGTEAMRGTFGDDFWLKRWATDYAKIKDAHSVVVADVRSNAEADLIRGLGGIVVHIVRDGAGLKGMEALHSSEAGITFNRKRDVRLNNNGTLDDLTNEAHAMITFIEKYADEFGLRNEVLEK
jgi:hypothetical protein